MTHYVISSTIRKGKGDTHCGLVVSDREHDNTPDCPVCRRICDELEIPLSFEDAESSVIAAASYEPGPGLLRVVFRSGKTYRYGGVPDHVWADFLVAKSRGSYFNRQIGPLFSGTQE